MINLGNQQNDIVLEKLDIYESGTFGQQYRRTIDTNVNGNTLQKLEEVTHGGAALNSRLVSDVASEIIVPSMGVDGYAHIAGGWGEKKFRYVMVLNIINKFGGFRNRKVLTGYTNHAGVSTLQGENSVHIDENMLFFINTDLTLRDTNVPSPCGTRMLTKTERVNADQVLMGNYEYGSRGGIDVSIRPEDILMNMSSGADVMAHGGGQVVDTYAQFVSSPLKLSARANASPTHYLYKILKSFADSSSYGDNSFAEDGYDDVILGAANTVRDRSFADDAFLVKLKEISDFMDQGYFTYRNLLQLFGNIDPVVTIHKYSNKGNMLITPPQAGDSARMDNNDATTMVMARISNSLPSLMFDCLLGACGFLFTNDTPGCEPQLTPINALLFGSLINGLDVMEAIQQFQVRFLTELAPTLTHHNQVKLTVKIVSQVFGATELIIDYNGGGQYKYNIPSFCDALISPMVTTQMGKVSNVARDIHNVLGVLGNQASPTNTLSPATMQNMPFDQAASQWGGGINNPFTPASAAAIPEGPATMKLF